jgi:hypothetical protein
MSNYVEAEGLKTFYVKAGSSSPTFSVAATKIEPFDFSK